MRKALFLTLALTLALLVPGLTAAAADPPAGTCCAVRFARCVANCGECGVFEFNCTLDFPGCSSNCICGICP